MGNIGSVKLLQEFASAWKRLNCFPVTLASYHVSLLKLLYLLWRRPLADLAAESPDQQAATHANAAMNAPHTQGHAQFFQSLTPCEDILVDTIHKSAIEIEEQGWHLRCFLSHGIGASSPQIYKGVQVLIFRDLELAP
jgi:hypothetical protein